MQMMMFVLVLWDILLALLGGMGVVHIAGLKTVSRRSKTAAALVVALLVAMMILVFTDMGLRWIADLERLGLR